MRLTIEIERPRYKHYYAAYVRQNGQRGTNLLENEHYRDPEAAARAAVEQVEKQCTGVPVQITVQMLDKKTTK
jgi:hypothetical protein